MNQQLKMRLFGVVALLGCVFILFTLIVQLSPRYGAPRYLSARGRGKVNQERIEHMAFLNEVLSFNVMTNLQTQSSPVVEEDTTAHALSVLLDNVIVPNAKTSYQPEKYQDLDIAEFARQTVITKTLWEIYETLPSAEDDSPSSRRDRIALKDAITRMQEILFPWMTAQSANNVGVSSIFDLQDTYRTDAGIVITTGKRGFRWTVHQITILRNVLNCNLPIEVYAANGESY